MKKIFCLLIAILFCCIPLSACGEAVGEACAAPPLSFADGHPYSPAKEFSFERKTQEKEFTFYFEAKLSKAKLEHGMHSVETAKKFHEVPNPVYFLEDCATCVGESGFLMNPSDPPELVLAILLESEAKHDLPFGIFAGVAASLLGDEAETSLLEGKRLGEKLQKYPYVKDLQYPLFQSCNTQKEERTAAWSFSLRLGKQWLNEHTVEELKTATAESLLPALMAIGADRPEFYCPVGDYDFIFQVITENFHYYFDSAFKDERLRAEDFSVNYPDIRAYILENERIFSKTQALLLEEQEKEQIKDEKEPEEPIKFTVIEVYIGDFGLLNRSVAYSDYLHTAICLKTVSYSVYMMTEFALYRTVGLRELRYGLCDYFNSESTYNKMLTYDLYRENTQNTSFEKKLLSSARKLYQKNFGKPDFDDFNVYGYFDCISQVLNENGDGKFEYFIQFTSFLHYLHEKYGTDLLFELDKNLRPSGEKTMETLIAEWKENLENTYGKSDD